MMIRRPPSSCVMDQVNWSTLSFSGTPQDGAGWSATSGLCLIGTTPMTYINGFAITVLHGCHDLSVANEHYSLLQLEQHEVAPSKCCQ